MKLGCMQTLQVIKRVDFGVYLGEKSGADATERVLLPKKQVPENVGIGDELEVFLYKDSKDRLIATTTRPMVLLDEIGVLTVKEVGKIGAFLDWGLEKDLFLPYKEMTRKVQEGDEILVRLYIDKSQRLCASTKGIYHYLSSQSPYQIGDEVEGRIYEFGHDFGTFVAVDDRYSAMLPKHEDVSYLKLGDVITAEVMGVKEDGKLDISMRKKAYLQMDDDAGKVMEIIDSYAGVLPFTEKATPEIIFRETGLSKAAFKRAVGRLYKERKITINDGKIRKV
ncbi:MAG: S1-like domain-containing RNA-binding protein [Lachnospiraceae bacterium]|nr:S1-like domain-containing RNA-binding protein [Lachnospiraceae bacterium]